VNEKMLKAIYLFVMSLQVFYWSHLLYIPFWVLVVFHGPNFWKWFIAPGILYLFERALRFASMRSEHGKTYISSGLLLPSRVTHLVIKRPHHFDFHPGDYVFVNVPAIAKYEWHPFTISSAPEQEGELQAGVVLRSKETQITKCVHLFT
jgi:predicted ferric reductase